MQLTRLNCPNCDAPLEIDMDNMEAYCPYCGQKLMFDTEQIGKLFAEREKTKQEQELTKRIEIQKKYKEREEIRSIKLLIGCVLFIILMFAIAALANWLESSEWLEKYSHTKNGEVQVSASAKDLKKEDYRNVMQRLKSDGFETIELIKEDDLILGILAKEGQVESVIINGDSEFLENEWFPADAVVQVTYHVFSED